MRSPAGGWELGLTLAEQLRGWVERLLFYLGEQAWGAQKGSRLFLTPAAPEMHSDHGHSGGG